MGVGLGVIGAFRKTVERCVLPRVWSEKRLPQTARLSATGVVPTRMVRRDFLHASLAARFGGAQEPREAQLGAAPRAGAGRDGEMGGGKETGGT